MIAATSGSRAIRFIMSSYEWSQYSALFVPFAYSRANTESVCSARIADDSCVIGCIPFGKLRIIPSTWVGSFARACSSFVSASACSFVGTSPVSSSQKSASGVGSPPGFAPGSFSWSSGIVYPRKRMPSSESSSDVSHSMHLMLRAPPSSWSSVTLSTIFDPCSFFIAFSSSTFCGIISISFSFRPDEFWPSEPA